MTAHRAAHATARPAARLNAAPLLAPHGAHGLIARMHTCACAIDSRTHKSFTYTRTPPCARAPRALCGLQACGYTCGGVRSPRAVAHARFHPYA